MANQIGRLKNKKIFKMVCVMYGEVLVCMNLFSVQASVFPLKKTSSPASNWRRPRVTMELHY